MTGKQRIREILQQSVQFTLLGDFPTAVPKDHNNWVNVMGKVYAFDFDQALDSIEEVYKNELVRANQEGYNQGYAHGIAKDAIRGVETSAKNQPNRGRWESK